VPAVICLGYQALSAWQLGQFASYRTTVAEAISLAKELNNIHGLAVALFWAAILFFLATLADDEVQIEASFCEAIRTAKKQKSISLTKRAEVSYAEYRSRKGNR
jgi:hypothetical protein